MVDHASEVPRLLASRKPSVIVLQESGIRICLLNAIASSGKEADVVLFNEANNLHMSDTLHMGFHLHRVVAHGIQRISNKSLDRSTYTTLLHMAQGPPIGNGTS